MRIHGSLRYAFLLALAASPAMLAAQFQAPTAEELNMKSDAKAPGAAAVYLNLEDVTDDPTHFHTVYARIKVLKDEGKSAATVEIPLQMGDSGSTSATPQTIWRDWWPDALGSSSAKAGRQPTAHGVFKITDIKARTIHADGTVIPLNVKAEDLEKQKADGRKPDRMVFTLPGVEVGSIVEYKYTLTYDDKHFSSPFWEVQRPYFVHKAHFAFTPFNYFLDDKQSATNRFLLDSHGKVVNTIIWSPVLPSGTAVKTDSIGHFTLDIADVPAIPSEEWMPPIEGISYHVLFYYKNAFSGAEFWANEEKLWTKEVDRFAEPTASIRQAESGIVATSDSDMDKAKKLYAAVQALTNTDFTPGKSQAPAQSAEDVWSRKSGSGNEIAVLYLALLRAAGLSAYDMKVVNRNKGMFSTAYLSFDQFDDDLVVVNVQGKDIFLDPGQKMCPFQTVHWKHAGASGVRQTANGPAIATAPLLPYAANVLVRSGDITIDEHNNFTGLFRFVMSGQESLFWRQHVLLDGQDDVKKHFDTWLASMVPHGVQAHFDHFLALDNADLNLVAVVNAEGRLESAGAGRYTQPTFFFEASAREPFVDAPQRTEPVDMHYGEQITDQVVYHLPAGLAVESVPADNKTQVEHYAVFATHAKSEAGQITMTRQLVRAFTIAGTAEYQALRDFYEKMAAADREQLVLVVKAN